MRLSSLILELLNEKTSQRTVCYYASRRAFRYTIVSTLAACACWEVLRTEV